MDLLAFVLAALGFAYLPGPAMLYTAAQTLGRGQRAGLQAVLGIHLGCYVHVAATTLGLAALFAAVPPAYVVMKLIGGAYLIWAGVRMWRQGLGDSPASNERASMGRVLRDSFLVELLNPKTALFFVAFLPQFVEPGATMPMALQLFCLGIVTNLIFSSADVVTVFLASPLRDWLVRGRGRSSCWLQRFGGSVLGGLGVNGLIHATR